MDLDRYDKVKCSKIEQMLPKLMKMVEGEDEEYEINYYKLYYKEEK